MSPTHGTGQRRWVVIVVVIAVLAGVAVAARTPGKSAPGGPPAVPASAVGAPGAESSAWYCTGQTTAAGQLAPGSVVLTNTGERTVRGTIHAVTDTGVAVQPAVSVPARGQVVANVPTPKTGTWISEAVTLIGGSVAVSQASHGPSGWAEAPCQSSTSQQWYFPSGVTTGSNALFIALFNPTSTPDVVDVSFVTRKGEVHPINFQGIVLRPGQMRVEPVSPFVQEQPSVATIVVTRTGRLVATELQLFSGDGTGLALVPGSPRLEQQWAIPQSVEVAGATSSIDVFNPGSTTQVVTVRLRLGSVNLSPFQARVSSDTTWVLATGVQTRIPKGDPYAALIQSRGGTGVVVGRLDLASGATQVPEDGMANAVDALSTALPARRWVVPSPGSAADPLLRGAAPVYLALSNLSLRGVTYVVEVMRPSGLRTIGSGHLASSSSFSLDAPILAQAGLNPLIVTSSGRVAVSEYIGPPGTDGVVTMPGIPLALGEAR